MLKYFSAFSIILVLASLPVEIVLACSCAKGETERSRFDRADYIALVKITDAELRDASELGYDEDMGDEYIRISFNEISNHR